MQLRGGIVGQICPKALVVHGVCAVWLAAAMAVAAIGALVSGSASGAIVVATIVLLVTLVVSVTEQLCRTWNTGEEYVFVVQTESEEYVSVVHQLRCHCRCCNLVF